MPNHVISLSLHAEPQCKPMERPFPGQAQPLLWRETQHVRLGAHHHSPRALKNRDIAHASHDEEEDDDEENVKELSLAYWEGSQLLVPTPTLAWIRKLWLSIAPWLHPVHCGSARSVWIYPWEDGYEVLGSHQTWTWVRCDAAQDFRSCWTLRRGPMGCACRTSRRRTWSRWGSDVSQHLKGGGTLGTEPLTEGGCQKWTVGSKGSYWNCACKQYDDMLVVPPKEVPRRRKCGLLFLFEKNIAPIAKQFCNDKELYARACKSWFELLFLSLDLTSTIFSWTMISIFDMMQTQWFHAT